MLCTWKNEFLKILKKRYLSKWICRKVSKLLLNFKQLKYSVYYSVFQTIITVKNEISITNMFSYSLRDKNSFLSALFLWNISTDSCCGHQSAVLDWHLVTHLCWLGHTGSLGHCVTGRSNILCADLLGNLIQGYR